MHLPLESTYFAYGSNMDKEQMAVRCPESKFLGVARLPGYNFQIYERGYASIYSDKSKQVHGVLWQLTEEDWDRLDRYEGLKYNLYFKSDVEVEFEGGFFRVQTYFGSNSVPGKPKAGYLEKILESANKYGFSSEYEEVLKSYF